MGTVELAKLAMRQAKQVKKLKTKVAKKAQVRLLAETLKRMLKDG